MWRLIPSIILVAVLTGCAGGDWSQYYQPNPAIKRVHFPKTDTVAVTTVEAERLKQLFAEDARLRQTSAVAVENESESDRMMRRSRMLTALRLNESPATVMSLGQSDFHAVNASDPHDGKLEAFAKRIGADYAVACIEYGGRGTQTVTIPVTSFNQQSGSATAYGAGGTVSAYGTSSGTSTAYVPQQIETDVWLHTVYFFRRIRPEDHALLSKR